MGSDFKPPDYLSMQRNAAEHWRRWLQRFELYMLAREADSKPEKTKIAILLSAIGPEALVRYNHFKWGKDEQQVSVPVQVQAEGQAGQQVQPGTRALEKELYADVVLRFEMEFAGMKKGCVLKISILGSSVVRRATFR